MDMIKVKTAELTGQALDWAVAQVVQPEGFVLRMDPEYDPPEPVLGIVMDASDLENSWLKTGWSPSTDWSQGGPLIDEHDVWLSDYDGACVASCEPHFGRYIQEGNTNLVAICRAVVATKLGDEVEVPQELVS